MKKYLLLIVVLSNILCAFGQSKVKRTITLKEGNYVPNKIIVKFKEGISNPFKSLSGTKSGAITLDEVQQFEQKFPKVSSLKGSSSVNTADTIGLDRIYEITYSGSKSISTVLEELNKRSDVEYAEPLYIAHTDYTPNDASYQLVSSYLTQIKAPQAWNLIRNSPTKVIIAIVDSGSDTDHPDLAANIYLNVNDPVNGVDDDGDGYTDNYLGWDFVGATNTNIQPDNDPNSANSNGDHGVHVSGIAAAVTDNASGVASVSFNSAKLMIVKTASDAEGTEIVRGYEGIKYAADHGANIINCSWGSEDASDLGQDIVNYVRSKGCLLVAAAGNSNTSTPQYPAGYEGVLAVANVQTNDVRSSSSNYGNYVRISAPGTNIYSTVIGSYGYKSGTSMASPVVASAAALVKAYLPNLTMEQVGERLRVTADDINSLNSSYKNFLGKGRLNVYRALTESQPSVRKYNTVITVKGSDVYAPGDTITIYTGLRNVLDPVSNLKVSLKSDDDNVVIIQGEANVAYLGAMSQQDNVGPFKLLVKPGVDPNYLVDLRFEYSANNNAYSDFEGFSLEVNRDYLNLQTNTIATTVTSVGKIGFVDAGDAARGNGFQYKGQQLLYEAALMIGNSSTSVSDNARSSSEQTDDDFIKRVAVKGATVADTVSAVAEFDDSGSINPLNVYVKHRSYVVNNSVSDNYLITEYEVINSGSTTLNNVYIGLFNDFDVNNSDYNATEFNAASRIAYTYDKASSSSPYAGVKLLSNYTAAYYPLSRNVSGNILANSEFTTAEKYQTLSSGIYAKSLSTTTSGSDVSFVTGYGPYSIPPGASIIAAFAYLGGQSQADVEQAGQVADHNYQFLKTELASGSLEVFSYRSSADNNIYAVIGLPEDADVSLKLYNMSGQAVKTITQGALSKGKYTFLVENTSSLPSGIYFYRLTANKKSKTFKIGFIN